MRLLFAVDVACLPAGGDGLLAGAWAVWRAVTVALCALPPHSRWAFTLFDGQARRGGAQAGLTAV
jgi:hypothetical protein